MLNRIPLGAAGWIVTHSHRYAKLITQLFLKLLLPDARAIAITSPSVCQNQQWAALGESLTHFIPPTSRNSVYHKPRCISRVANVNVAAIVDHVVDAIGYSSSNRIRPEVVCVDILWFLAPSLSVVLEISNQLLLLCVNADNRPPCGLKSLYLGFNVLKLRVPIRMIFARLCLNVDFQRVSQILQQPAYRWRTGRMPGIAQALAQRAQAATYPFLITRRIARRFRRYHIIQNSSYRPVFFSTSGRPPPGRRTRSVGRPASPVTSSSCPRLIVFSSIPVIWDSKRIPP
jgi:hypothetical protein